MPKKAEKTVPQGMNTVTLYLSFKGNCAQAVEFYKKAFDAKSLVEPVSAPDGRILHTMVKIGDTNIMMSDAFATENMVMGNMTQMWVYVNDCDALFNRAVEAGCKVTMKMADQFWGDRVGQVQDPFGYFWSIDSKKYDLTPQEMQENQKEWLKLAGMQ